MYTAAEFQRMCEELCERLTRDAEDPEAFQMLHSTQFTFACASMGLEADDVARQLERIAAERRSLAASASMSHSMRAAG